MDIKTFPTIQAALSEGYSVMLGNGEFAKPGPMDDERFRPLFNIVKSLAQREPKKDDQPPR